MEAVPRLPMISFETKVSTEIVYFSSKLKQYMSTFYHEDPESYNNEIHSLETLRAAAVRPNMDVAGCQLLKKYYCQLHFLKSRFPMEENQSCAVYFSWRDSYSNMVCSVPDVDFELMNVLYNIGAVHSKLGAMDSRITPEGMKMACTHFQCAAWAFQIVRETYPQLVSLVLAPEIIHFMHLTCLAQAQECILEKSMMDNRKATIIAKVAVQVVDYYKKALTTLQSSGEEGSLSDLLGSRTYKDWIKYLNFKVAYHKSIALLYQGQQAEEQQKMGERVAFYQAASDQLQEACKRANNLSHQQEISEALAFTGDVVEGKKKAAKNENEFIYHEDVPDKDALQEVKGASLVKGIAFNVNDSEVSGADIFARLVPMEAHEASSLYSEKKAQMLRQLGELVEDKNRSLVEFMSSLQLDVLTQMRQATGLTQDLVDRAAAMSARPTAAQDLVHAMGKLSNMYHDVEATLAEIESLLKEEEKKEASYQAQMGTRPPSIIATDLTREYTKYQEAHSKASDSNQNLHRAMTTHVANLKVLSLPLGQLKQQIPSVEFPSREIDEDIVREMETLVAKVEEMKHQRALLWAQLRDATQNDDITGLLVTRQPDKSLEQLFQQELDKHKKQASLIEQNMAAQDNILKALVEAYARFAGTRRYLTDVIAKRAATLVALVNSYDAYDDLMAKANKGAEFYGKLETNVTKLLQRIRSTCNVQDEEREQILSKQNEKFKAATPHLPASGVGGAPAPKLRDYLLDSKVKDRLDVGGKMATVDSGLAAYPATVTGLTDQMWPPGVRPSPVGSEMTADNSTPSSSSRLNETYGYSYGTNPNQTYYNAATTAVNASPNTSTTYSSSGGGGGGGVHNYSYVQPVAGKGVEQDLSDRMAVLLSSNRSAAAVVPESQPNNSSLSYGYQANVASVYQQPIAEQYSKPELPAGPPSYSSGFGTTTATATAVQPQTMYAPGSYYPYQTTTDYTYFSAGSYDPSMAQSYNTQSTTVTYPATTSVEQSSSAAYNNQPRVSYGQENVPSLAPGTLYNYGSVNDNVYTQSLGNQGCTTSGYYNSSQATTNNQNEFYGAGVDYSAASSVQDYNSSQQQQYREQPGQSYSTIYGNQQAHGSVSSHSEMTPITYVYGNMQNSVTDYTNYSANYAPANASSYTNYTNTGASNQNVAAATTTPNVITDPSSQLEKEKSNIDLLSGLDFTINQAPLLPQQNKVNALTKEGPTVKTESPAVLSTVKTAGNTKSEEKLELSSEENRYIERQYQWNSFQDPEVLKLFGQEVEKFEKSVEILSTKTLNGPTPLDIKWKEIQDRQDAEQRSKSISVARCYPMKNRFPDILPYDQTRVTLAGAKDDYINASYIKDVSPNSPLFIVTQSPTQSTFSDFWTMVWEQHVEIVLCLLNDAELNREIYWPKGQEPLVLGNLSITQQTCTVRNYWNDCVLCINQLERRSSRMVRLMQFTAWPSSIFPTSPASVAEYVEEVLKDQKALSRPVLVHCLAGIGRSGLFCLLISAAVEVLINPRVVPDLPSTAVKLSSARKNIIRDREHLKFAYSAFLHFLKGIYTSRVGGRQDNPGAPAVPNNVATMPNDPLNMLDPLWASKKGT